MCSLLSMCHLCTCVVLSAIHMFPLLLNIALCGPGCSYPCLCPRHLVCMCMCSLLPICHICNCVVPSAIHICFAFAICPGWCWVCLPFACHKHLVCMCMCPLCCPCVISVLVLYYLLSHMLCFCDLPWVLLGAFTFFLSQTSAVHVHVLSAAHMSSLLLCCAIAMYTFFVLGICHGLSWVLLRSLLSLTSGVHLHVCLHAVLLPSAHLDLCEPCQAAATGHGLHLSLRGANCVLS